MFLKKAKEGNKKWKQAGDREQEARHKNLKKQKSDSGRTKGSAEGAKSCDGMEKEEKRKDGVKESNKKMRQQKMAGREGGSTGWMGCKTGEESEKRRKRI